MNRQSVWILAAALSLAAAAACSKQSGESGEQPASGAANEQATVAGGGAIDSAQAKQIFDSRCAACHGPDGRGNGPGAAALNPKPRNYHDQEWQSKVTDDEIRKAIVYGGAAVGKSPAMVSNPDLDSKPAVVEGLLHIVRDFGKSS